jgi:hypothetical protein
MVEQHVQSSIPVPVSRTQIFADDLPIFGGGFMFNTGFQPGMPTPAVALRLGKFTLPLFLGLASEAIT